MGASTAKRDFLLWQEIRSLPIRVVEIPANEMLLDLALKHNLAVYDAGYLSLAVTRSLPIATGDGKLATATQSVGLGIIRP